MEGLALDENVPIANPNIPQFLALRVPLSFRNLYEMRICLVRGPHPCFGQAGGTPYTRPSRQALRIVVGAGRVRFREAGHEHRRGEQYTTGRDQPGTRKSSGRGQNRTAWRGRLSCIPPLGKAVSLSMVLAVNLDMYNVWSGKN